jgi:hypothetical protein
MKSVHGTKISHSVWLLSSLMLSALLASPRISPAAEDTWTYKTNMPTVGAFFGGGVVGGKIYVIGGTRSNFSVISAVKMYDPTTDTWATMANMPSGRCAHATCTLDGKIYVFGGVSPDPFSTAKKSVHVYDPRTDAWTQKADMPYANAGCGIAVVDGTIYLIGGTLTIWSPPVSTVMAYDPITESWTQKADMPTARFFLSACVVDGKIYAIGGCPEDWQVLSYKDVEVYDPSTDSWTRKSDMPTERWGLGACVVDGKIYAIGGRLHGDACTANEVYDPITDTWTTKSPMQQKRKAAFVCSIGDKIYAIGGAYDIPQQTFLSVVEEYETGLGVPPPDLNGDDIVNFKDFCRLARYWCQDESSVDIGPGPFGDDVVDSKDLAILGDYWLIEVLSDSLIAYWKLDETEGFVAHDTVADYDAFVLTDNPLWRPTDGMVNGALELDGSDDFVSVPFVLNPADGGFSIFTWIKGGAAGQVVLSQIGAANWLMADPATGALMTELEGTGRFAEPLISDAVITDDNWHRVGFTWDGSNRVLYIDDVEAARDTQSSLASSETGLYIGAGKDRQLGSFFSGLVDDVRVYNRAIVP